MEKQPAARTRRVTITQIAATLGITPATVSNAFNRPDQLSPELREKVLAKAKQMGYAGPNAAARSLRSGRAGAFGVLYGDRLSYAFADPAFVQFLAGAATATEVASLGLLLLPGVASAPAAVRDAVVDGFLVYAMYEGDPLVQAMFDRQLPVAVSDGPRRPGVPFVGIDDVAAARMAAEHLLALGHRHFGILSLESDMARHRLSTTLAHIPTAAYLSTRDRLRGYAESLAAAGIPLASTPVLFCAENDEVEGRAAAMRLFAFSPRPTALMAMSDRLALGAAAAAWEAGLTVPHDISIIGFDDIPAATLTTPPLTTIHQPHREKGEIAGRRLVALLRGEEDEGSAMAEILPVRLIVRGSTAPPLSSA